ETAAETGIHSGWLTSPSDVLIIRLRFVNPIRSRRYADTLRHRKTRSVAGFALPIEGKLQAAWSGATRLDNGLQQSSCTHSMESATEGLSCGVSYYFSSRSVC